MSCSVFIKLWKRVYISLPHRLPAAPRGDSQLQRRAPPSQSHALDRALALRQFRRAGRCVHGEMARPWPGRLDACVARAGILPCTTLAKRKRTWPTERFAYVPTSAFLARLAAQLSARQSTGRAQ